MASRKPPKLDGDQAHLLLEHTWDMVYRHDTRGVMEYVSPSIERISGYSPRQWMRHYSTFMTSSPMNDTVREYTEDTLRTGRRHPPYLVEIRRKDGRTALLEVSERAFRRRGKIAGIIGVAREVTERENASAELQRLVGLLSRANEDLADFASFASHDLQGPLMDIAVRAGMISRTASDPDMRAHLDAIAADASRLQTLVRSMLEYAHAGRSEVRPRAVALSGVLAAALSSLRRPIQEAGARVLAKGLPRVKGEPVALQRVLANLVGNSLKHRGAAAPVIRVEARRDGPKWRVTVRDNGAGIPAGREEEAFLPFRRLRRDGPPGSGIGLAICRRIVERHGGRIWAQPGLKSGAAVHFTLPSA